VEARRWTGPSEVDACSALDWVRCGSRSRGENGLRWSQAESGAGASWAGHGRELGREEKRERRTGLREGAGPGILLGLRGKRRGAGLGLG